MTEPNKHDSTVLAFEKLVEIMRTLRAPVGGCPWDIEQTFETIAPYTIEEAYEVADAIERKKYDWTLKRNWEIYCFKLSFIAKWLMRQVTSISKTSYKCNYFEDDPPAPTCF